ncbi:MAG: DUF1573 domain-containing protein [Gemmatales bacterium]|nr:DUF1573 domain-containing protein [Gemmatales bacterium]MCS7159044.1 DUF1573 domain-containing protein [Gemmatales bacterium]MDW8174244.1 DUF1573 domain-containing protein [Gemmatales bacterium]MDW8222323.1 DUF1573 domain-containing protein [Gemmatales bacterium]
MEGRVRPSGGSPFNSNRWASLLAGLVPRLWKYCLACVMLELCCVMVGLSGNQETLLEEAGHDFGMVPQGAILIHRFRWRNPTREAIEVTRIQASCSSVQAQAHPQRLEPGATGFVEVQMDTRKLMGKKHVVITMDRAPARRSERLWIKAEIVAGVMVHPGQLRFAGIDAGSAAEQSIEITRKGGADWRIDEVQAPRQLVAVRWETTFRQFGEVRYRITARLHEIAPSGDWIETIQLRTNDPRAPILGICLEARIRPAITVSPAELRLPYTGPMGEASWLVLRGQQPFRIVGIQSVPAGVHVEAEYERPQVMQVVKVRWERPDQVAPGTIRLATDCAQQPSVEIPVRVRMLP